MKRGQTNLSLMLAVDKPLNMTSHDVVNRVRRVFGERRVGHAGTLDPLAGGVLVILVGPASRLNPYLESESKTYDARICFGASTDTDDAEGTVIRTAPVRGQMYDRLYAEEVLSGFKGPQMQMPPAYSAIKRAGVKSCDAARKGVMLDLESRPIEVEDARLNAIGEEEGSIFWDVTFKVSKGTYIRALARDIGKACKTEAHLKALKRTGSGRVSLSDCTSLEALESLKEKASLDPIKVLGHRFAYLDGASNRNLENGNSIPSKVVTLHEYARDPVGSLCACTAGVMESCAPVKDGELVSMIADNRLKGIYSFSAAEDAFVPRCVFSIGVTRGSI